MIIKIEEEEKAKERHINIHGHVNRYLEFNNYEKGYEIHHPNMPYIGGLERNYEQLRDNPRFIELLKKMNLPLPED